MDRPSFLARLLCLLLMVGLVALHFPLEAFAAPVGEPGGCCSCDRPPPTSGPRCEAVPDDLPPSPAPADGCEDGCHCGCCGGLPLVTDGPLDLPARLAGLRSPSPAVNAVQPARPGEIFHPPRA